MAEITNKQQTAIQKLLSERTIGDAAKAANIGERTLHRWLAEDLNFQGALRQAEKAALETFTRSLVGMAEKASQAIRDGLEDESINVRLKSADIFLNRLIQLRQLVDFEERINALEQARESHERLNQLAES